MTLEYIEGTTQSDHKTHEERKKELEIMNIYKDYEEITDEKALEYLVTLQIERDELLKQVNDRKYLIGVFIAGGLIGVFIGLAMTII